jgi:hypothetical protein
LVRELAESGAGDEVIDSIAGHVSRAMLSRYSHVRMEAKRRALDEIAMRQNATDQKRQKDAERLEQPVWEQRLPSVQISGGGCIGLLSRITVRVYDRNDNARLFIGIH